MPRGWWEAVPGGRVACHCCGGRLVSGAGPRQPAQRAGSREGGAPEPRRPPPPPTGHVSQGASAGPPRPHSRAHSTWVADLDSQPRGRAVGEGGAPDPRRPAQRRKTPPSGTPFRHPHSTQRRPARAHAVGPVLGPHARTDRTRDTRVAEPRLPAPEDGRPWPRAVGANVGVCGVCGACAVCAAVRGVAFCLSLWCPPLRCFVAVLCSPYACRARFPARVPCLAAGFPLFLPLLRRPLPFPLLSVGSPCYKTFYKTKKTGCGFLSCV